MIRALRIGLLALAALLVPCATLAETVTSPGPATVSVSVYRAPDRGVDTAMQLGDLQGYALITETRSINIPAGDGVIRFEGVAGGILPESAIVTGLAEGVIEKNQDANLLSPASLLGASAGRRVTIRRTNRRTGVVREESAVIRSGPEGAVVLQTAAGIEALQCTGIPETIVYDSVPEGLSAKPTLSVRTHSARALSAMVTLSYLADNFDWQANYVATIADDARHLDLFGWVTLASADETSFPNAQAMAIAGRVNRSAFNDDKPEASDPGVRLQCWPAGTTSDIDAAIPPPPPPPLPAPAPAMLGMMEDIVVTARRRDEVMQKSAVAVTAVQEELGDLKLYRIPVAVTVAAHSQKQVALLDKGHVPITVVYRSTIDGTSASPPVITIRAHNKLAEGLGLPLPLGRVAIYQAGEAQPMLLGDVAMADKAVGEDVEIDAAPATNATVAVTQDRDHKDRRIVTVSNANPHPIRIEAKFASDGAELLSAFSGKVRRKDGVWLWEITVPANATAKIGYRAQRSDRSDPVG